jgi:hypothetical protein
VPPWPCAAERCDRQAITAALHHLQIFLIAGIIPDSPITQGTFYCRNHPIQTRTVFQQTRSEAQEGPSDPLCCLVQRMRVMGNHVLMMECHRSKSTLKRRQMTPMKLGRVAPACATRSRGAISGDFAACRHPRDSP